MSECVSAIGRATLALMLQRAKVIRVLEKEKNWSLPSADTWSWIISLPYVMGWINESANFIYLEYF